MKTLSQKIWDSHVVHEEPGAPSLLYIDLHLVHEVTSPQAFSGLRERGLKVRRPDRTLGTVDHSIPTTDRSLPILDPIAAKQVTQFEANCAEFGIPCFGVKSENQGICHVIGPEQGATQPGMTVVCGDSHTATHGAFGALAFGIGTSEVENVLATQCLLQRPSTSFRVRVDGILKNGVGAKDIILALIARIGIGGGTGAVMEYSGSAIRSLDMDGRMTVCNMSIEGGARAGLIAPDDTTFNYLHGRPLSPKDAAWDAAVARWKQLPSDAGATFDREEIIDASSLAHDHVGNNPSMGISVTGAIPDPGSIGNLRERESVSKALAYMGLEAGEPILGHPINVVFIGSCTNSRITDSQRRCGTQGPESESERSRDGGSGLHGSEAPGHRRRAAGSVPRRRLRLPRTGLLYVHRDEWRSAQPGEYSVSTSNRNFEGRRARRQDLSGFPLSSRHALTGNSH